MLTSKLRMFVAGLAITFLASCALPAPSSNSAPPSGDDAYFVLGVTPENVRIDIVDGTIRNGAFNLPFIRLMTPSYMPSPGGYIVVKAKGGASYGLLTAGMMFGDQGVFGEFYQPSGGTLVFNVPVGKVIYVTNIVYHRNSGYRLMMDQAPDRQGARDFMRQHYPQLADRLEQGQFGFLPLR